MALMQIDRGITRESVVMCEVDTSAEIAGQCDCIECGGSGDWRQFHPEPHLFPNGLDCVECKGTGKIWVGL